MFWTQNTIRFVAFHKTTRFDLVFVDPGLGEQIEFQLTCIRVPEMFLECSWIVLEISGIVPHALTEVLAGSKCEVGAVDVKIGSRVEEFLGITRNS